MVDVPHHCYHGRTREKVLGAIFSIVDNDLRRRRHLADLESDIGGDDRGCVEVNALIDTGDYAVLKQLANNCGCGDASALGELLDRERRGNLNGLLGERRGSGACAAVNRR
jgi:hypothetical protein